MKKVRRYFLDPSHTKFSCYVWINGRLIFMFERELYYNQVVATCTEPKFDVTTFDLELHAFLRVSHQLIVNPDSMNGVKIEEMFEMENPNI